MHKRRLAFTLAALAAASAIAAGAQAQTSIPTYKNANGTSVPPQINWSLGRQSVLATETTFTLVAGTWTQVSAANPARLRLTLADANGLGCLYSYVAAPISGEGVPFSLVGTPGSYVLDEPMPTNLVMVKCTNAGVVTTVAQ